MPEVAAGDLRPGVGLGLGLGMGVLEAGWGGLLRAGSERAELR